MLSSYQKGSWQQEGVNDIICGIGKTKDFLISPFFFLANKCMHSQHWGSTKILSKNKYQHQLL